MSKERKGHDVVSLRPKRPGSGPTNAFEREPTMGNSAPPRPMERWGVRYVGGVISEQDADEQLAPLRKIYFDTLDQTVKKAREGVQNPGAATIAAVTARATRTGVFDATTMLALHAVEPGETVAADQLHELAGWLTRDGTTDRRPSLSVVAGVLYGLRDTGAFTKTEDGDFARTADGTI
jgi:hypothetical protein